MKGAMYSWEKQWFEFNRLGKKGMNRERMKEWMAMLPSGAGRP